MTRKWRWFLPGYLFILPMTLAGLVISKFFYKATSYLWHDGVLTCVGAPGKIWGNPNAQTLGWLQVYDTMENRTVTNLRVHENVHVIQGFVGGLFGLILTPLLFIALGWSPRLGLALGGLVGGLGFAALYGILFIYLLIKQGTGWYDAYRNNPFEVQAYDLQDKYLEKPDPDTWGV